MPFAPLEFPPWCSWRQRKGIWLPQPPGVGPNGRKLCRWCAAEVPKGSRSWCGDACLKKYFRVFSWERLREYVMARDGGLCRRCGSAFGGKAPSHAHSGWQVDHIVPVKDGGTDDPENLRLLCWSCHVSVGYEQRELRKGKAKGDS